jgi:hypothetical protein
MATILTGDAAHEVDAGAAPGTLLLDPANLEDLTGWELKPEGLCRGDICVPTRHRPDIEADGQIDLRVFADLLARPLAVDDETQTAAIGESPAHRESQLDEGALDGLVLRDADGEPFRWDSIGRKKKVLVTWASW